MVPVLAAAVIVVGLFCGWGLARLESSTVARIQGNAAYSFHDELEKSPFASLKQRYVQQRRDASP